MQISLRSQMIAGTAAIVGASAIAMTPVVAQQHALPNIQVPAISAEVGLAGFNSPITDLILAAGTVNKYLTSDAAVGAPWTYEGLLPQIINDALPIVRQLGFNGTEYINKSLGYVGTAGYLTSEVVWNLPGNLLDAATLAFNGNISGAVALLQATVLDPLTNAAKAVGNAIAVPIQGIVTRALAVAALIPGGISGLISNTVKQGQVLLGALITPIQAAFSAGNIEGAWNAIVDGYFKDLPNAVTALTVGLGVPTVPLGFVPSIRTELTTAGQSVVAALQTSPPPPPFAAKPAAPKAAKSVAATLAAEEAPAVEAPATTAGDNSATPGDNNGGGSSSGGSSSGGGHSKGTGGSRANR